MNLQRFYVTNKVELVHNEVQDVQEKFRYKNWMNKIEQIKKGQKCLVLYFLLPTS